MNILVIGNGFDLAHGLPTKYTDFLEFVKQFEELYESVKQPKFDLYVERKCVEENSIKSIILDLFLSKCSNSSIPEVETAKKLIEELDNLIKDNIWIDYFLQNLNNLKENWIDFESEISKVVKAMSSAMEKYKISLYEKERNFKDGNTYDLNQEYDKILDIIKKCKKKNKEITYVEIRNYLLKDLEKLIRAFEIYLTEYVEKIDCKLIYRR